MMGAGGEQQILETINIDEATSSLSELGDRGQRVAGAGVELYGV